MAARPTESPNHAALMDAVYRHQRYLYDFTRKYYLFGRDRAIAELALEPDESLVEVGCGTARNLIRIARRYPQSRLFGLDASREMLKTAEIAVARAGLAGRIKLAHGYAEALSPDFFGEDRAFDRVLFSYSLSMIPDWKQALRAANATMAPAGRIHVVDFGDLRGLGRLGAGFIRWWLGLFHVEPRIEIVKTFETAIGLNALQDSNLRILMGRYAFVLCCGKDGIMDCTRFDVAA
jgi:S-adenosylmethionine-diacylgycerolhomoserine-N-methlytransferase